METKESYEKLYLLNREIKPNIICTYSKTVNLRINFVNIVQCWQLTLL
jgi:hypothetical protein